MTMCNPLYNMVYLFRVECNLQACFLSILLDLGVGIKISK